MSVSSWANWRPQSGVRVSNEVGQCIIDRYNDINDNKKDNEDRREGLNPGENKVLLASRRISGACMIVYKAVKFLKAGRGYYERLGSYHMNA